MSERVGPLDISLASLQGAPESSYLTLAVDNTRPTEERPESASETLREEDVLQAVTGRVALNQAVGGVTETDGPGAVRLGRARHADRSTVDSIARYFEEASKTELLTAEEEVELAKRIEVGVFAQERIDMAQAGEIPRLSLQDYRDLRTLAMAGVQAKEQFIYANLRLVATFAYRRLGRGLDLLDLLQEGSQGLDRAVQKFDYRKGYKFSTYASWWIKQSMDRAIADIGRAIRLPVDVVAKVNAVNRVRSELLQTLWQEPTPEQIAEELGCDVEQVIDLLDISRDPLSTDMRVGEGNDGSTLGDMIREDIEGFDISIVRYDAQERVYRELCDLFSPRAADIVLSHLGLTVQGGFSEQGAKDFDEIGARWYITPAHARQLYHKTMLQLRTKPQEAERLMELLRS